MEERIYAAECLELESVFGKETYLSRKRKCTIPDCEKDEKYWEKRQRNNLAAKRCRENRRQLEMDEKAKAAILERENLLLKQEIEALKKAFGIPLNKIFLTEENDILTKTQEDNLKRENVVVGKRKRENDNASRMEQEKDIVKIKQENDLDSRDQEYDGLNDYESKNKHVYPVALVANGRNISYHQLKSDIKQEFYSNGISEKYSEEEGRYKLLMSATEDFNQHKNNERYVLPHDIQQFSSRNGVTKMSQTKKKLSKLCADILRPYFVKTN